MSTDSTLQRFNALETLRILFSHPEVMYACIREMDQQGERFIRELALTGYVRAYSAKLSSKESKRLRIAFDAENLYRCNVVSDREHRRNESRLYFQDSVIAAFRLTHVGLYEAVTDVKLIRLLTGLRESRDRLTGQKAPMPALSFVDTDPDYTEFVEDLFEQLSGLVGLMRSNILKLEDMGRNLEAMSADASRKNTDFDVYRQTLFEQIAHIYNRQVIPVMNFLDHRQALKDGTNLFQTLDEIARAFSINGRQPDSDNVAKVALSLSGMFRPIQQVAGQTSRYLHKTRRAILEQNAMESFYGDLVKDLRENVQSDMRGKYIRGVPERLNLFEGLKRRQRPKSYLLSDTKAYYDTLLSEMEARIEDARQLYRPIIQAGEIGFSDAAAQRQQRAERLYGWLRQCHLRPSRDIVAALHYRLQDWVEGYTFVDLLTAFMYLQQSTPPGMQIITTNHRRYLREQDEFHIYRKSLLIRDNGDAQSADNEPERTHDGQ